MQIQLIFCWFESNHSLIIKKRIVQVAFLYIKVLDYIRLESFGILLVPLNQVIMFKIPIIGGQLSWLERLTVNQNVASSSLALPAIYGDNRTMVSTQVCDTWNMSSILIYHPNSLMAWQSNSNSLGSFPKNVGANPTYASNISHWWNRQTHQSQKLREKSVQVQVLCEIPFMDVWYNGYYNRLSIG